MIYGIFNFIQYFCWLAFIESMQFNSYTVRNTFLKSVKTIALLFLLFNEY